MGNVIESRRIIRQQQHAQIEDDHWVHLADDDPLPTVGDVTVTSDRMRADREAISTRAGRVGLRVEGSTDPEAIADLLDVDLVTVWIPKFSDGRYFTLARLLRTRYGFAGQLRAAGDVLPDQLFYMRRVGFDAFELRQDQRLETGIRALSAFSVSYQGSADEPRPLFRRVTR